MFDYDLFIPTHVIFGKGRIKDLPAQLSKFGRKVLLTYGGGSIKKIGLYDTVKALLKDFEVFELPGIEPNPKISSVREGVAICKKEHIDVILAVGGGSVIDASKNIACGACFDGDPWDLVLDCSKVEKALPIVSVLTLTATGSEYDGSAVISNPETNEKLPLFGTGILEPKVSFLDPEYTYSVPKSQTIAGAADIMLADKLRKESLDYTKDQFGYQLGNIRALPDSLVKLPAQTYNNKIWPFVEYYTCTNEEKLALKNKIKYNGMTIMRIGTIKDFIRQEESYIKGKLIRTDLIKADSHEIMELAAELNQGIFIKE